MNNNELRRRNEILEGFGTVGEIGNIRDFFNDEFIDYILSNKKYGIRPDFIEEFGVYDLIKQPLGNYEIKLFKAFIHMELDVSSVVEKMNDVQKEQISELGVKLLDEGKIKALKLSKIMDKSTLTNYLEQNEDRFSNRNIISFIRNRKIERIPNKILDSLIESESYEECKEIAKDYGLDKSFLERKQGYDREQLAIREKTRQRKLNMHNIEEKGAQELTESEIKTLIEDTSAVQFYKMASQYNFSKQLISQRQKFDEQILDNSLQYSKNTVLEAFSGLYYKNSINNVLIDLETLITYGENEPEFKDNIKDFELIREIYNFLSDNIEPSNPSDFQDKINYFKEKCKYFDYEMLKDVKQTSTRMFNDDLSKELGNTRDKIVTNIEPEIIDGTNVKLYRIENQSENQRDFMILIHAESIENARNYYGSNRHKDRMSFSVLDDNHFETYIADIKFGYYSLKDEKIYSVNTCDGQTGQYINESNIEYARKMQNELYSIRGFMNRTAENSYNEITITDEEKDGIRPRPDYLMINHEIPSDEEIEIAQKYNIPIYFINYEKYIDKNKIINKKTNEKPLGIYSYKEYRDIERAERFLNELDNIDNSEYIINITSTQNLGKETINEQKDTLGKNEIGQEMAKHISKLNNEHDVTYYED